MLKGIRNYLKKNYILYKFVRNYFKKLDII